VTRSSRPAPLLAGTPSTRRTTQSPSPRSARPTPTGTALLQLTPSRCKTIRSRGGYGLGRMVRCRSRSLYGSGEQDLARTDGAVSPEIQLWWTRNGFPGNRWPPSCISKMARTTRRAILANAYFTTTLKSGRRDSNREVRLGSSRSSSRGFRAESRRGSNVIVNRY
jgi:hypothetical protein